jgi:hypothetical protein
MKLKDHIADLEDRRTALIAKANDTSITAAQRTGYEDQLRCLLAEIKVLADDMKTDAVGYLTWRVADDNEAEQKRVRKWTQ